MKDKQIQGTCEKKEPSHKLYEAISEIKAEYIEEAERYEFPAMQQMTGESAASISEKARNKTAARGRLGKQLLKWGSLAACFCIVLVGASLVMSGAFVKKGAMDGYNGSNEGPTPTPGGSLQTVLAYNGALYNLSNEIGFLNRAGIENIITSEDCGALIGNLAKTEQGYEETTEHTGIGLYKYAPAYSNTAVVVVRDGEEYMAGLFSNNLPIGSSNDYSPISELYRRYGVETAEQIASVVEVNSVEQGSVVAEKITEASVLAAFYEATMSMEDTCIGREDFEINVEDNMTEEEYLAHVEGERAICIETAEGLKFYLNWYPGWFYASGATAYYELTEEMKKWLEVYMP